MNKAKKYYVDRNGNMIGYPKYMETDRIEKEPYCFKGRLKIQYIGWLNKGFYLILEDENGNTFSMNDVMFKDYVSRNDIYLNGKWTFYSQGMAYSIGLEDAND